MKRFGILLAMAAFGAALVASRPASSAEVGCFYNGSLHTCIGILDSPMRMSPTAMDLGHLGPWGPHLWRSPPIRPRL